MFLKVNEPTNEQTATIFHLKDTHKKRNDIAGSYRLEPKDEKTAYITFRFSCTYWYDRGGLWRTRHELETLSEPFHIDKARWNFFTFVLDIEARAMRVFVGSSVHLANLHFPNHCGWKRSDYEVKELITGQFRGNEELYCLQIHQRVFVELSELDDLSCNCRKKRPCGANETSVYATPEKFPETVNGYMGYLNGLVGFWPLILNELTGWSVNEMYYGRQADFTNAKTIDIPGGSGEMFYITSADENIPMATFNLSGIKLLSEGFSTSFYLYMEDAYNLTDEKQVLFEVTGKYVRYQFVVSSKGMGYVKGKSYTDMWQGTEIVEWHPIERSRRIHSFYFGIDLVGEDRKRLMGINYRQEVTGKETYKSDMRRDDTEWQLILRPPKRMSLVALTIYNKRLEMNELIGTRNMNSHWVPKYYHIEEAEELQSNAQMLCSMAHLQLLLIVMVYWLPVI